MKDLELLAGTLHRDGEDIYWELVRDAEAGKADQRPVVVCLTGPAAHMPFGISRC